MPPVFPFRGVRYTYRDPEEQGCVIAPPYDVIDREAQEAYYSKHAHNIIRLELGEVLPSDDRRRNRYTRALETYQSWQKEGVLARDDEPSIYLYRQDFPYSGRLLERWAVFASVGLVPHGEGVYPHEDTLPKPLEDRMNLLRTLRVNLSPIFGLYPDRGNTVIQGLKHLSRRLPDSVAVDGEDTHSIWAIAGEQAAGYLSVLQESPIFVADGHHRYETALRHHLEANGGSGRVLMALANLFDPSLVVMPTHRLLRGMGERSLRNIEGFRFQPQESLDRLMTEVERCPVPAFGLYTAEGFGLCTLTEEGSTRMAALKPEYSPTWRELDVSVIQALVLEGPLAGAEVGFTRDAAWAVSQVKQCQWQAALFVRTCGVEAMTQVALRGERMPQKSTYFYPKLPTGLVIHPLD